MSNNISLKKINKVNELNIESAGPRYTPSLDSEAPNLEIESLFSAVRTLGLSDEHRKFIYEFIPLLEKSWKDASKETKKIVSRSRINELKKLINRLSKKNPRQTMKVLISIKGIVLKLSSDLRKESQNLWDRESGAEESPEEWRKIRSEATGHRKFISSIQEISEFIGSPDYELITNNLMLVLGDWGVGKTHTLCDISIQRTKKGLPTLFILANKLQENKNPLETVCSETGLASSPIQLLKQLDKLGKSSNGRALIIFDGINEGNRDSWKRYISQIISLVKKYKNVGLILSCRTPFDKNIFSKHSRSSFVRVVHYGFQDIEFDAQKAFFKYYKIPNPHVPLLVHEFSKPLFLKILCSSLSGKTTTTKSRNINMIASGQKSFRKILEDFVKKVGEEVENDCNLRKKTCWLILKGVKKSSGVNVGISSLMAERTKDYIDMEDAISVIKEITGKSRKESHLIKKHMLLEGLLGEDVIWEDGSPKEVIRMPYQRFSDHLIAIHLINSNLNTKNELKIRRSFYKNKPLGKIFEIDQWGREYKHPGIASAIMLEFPERVKRTLPKSSRELVYYLPKKQQRLNPAVDIFLEGLLWRNKDSFSDQTSKLLNVLLSTDDNEIRGNTFETLVTLACRNNHPYSSTKIWDYLYKMDMAKRDIIWSEYIRKTYKESVVHRLLSWIIDSEGSGIDSNTARNLVQLVGLFLTTTDRPTRDKATKALVILGEECPGALFEITIKSLGFNDSYIPERMLAASYGLLMRKWAFPTNEIKESIKQFSCDLYDSLFAEGAVYATTHILMRDYVLGILELSQKIDSNCLGKRSVRRLKIPLQKPVKRIPDFRYISSKHCEKASEAIHMDFENYTIGRLAPRRNNYDFEHKEYRGILKQIKWRILNLGYSPELFKEVDRSISERDFYRRQRDGEGKVDRYGKKYSWIAYFEVSGLRLEKGLLDLYPIRIPSCDIDPSFPEGLKAWKPPLESLFSNRLTSVRSWTVEGDTPSYDHLIKMEKVDGIEGPWVLIGGYISESAPFDARKVFTFINPVLSASSDISKLRSRFNNKEYPGNHEIPGPWEDYYTFVGEVPWSRKFGGEFFEGLSSKQNIKKCFSLSRTHTIRKKSDELTESEILNFSVRASPLISKDPDTGETVIGMLKEPKNFPEYIDLKQNVNTPGIEVEIPTHSLGWESYHSTENQGGCADFLAPALCDFLELKNRDGLQDLFDKKGNQATIYRTFRKDDSDYFKSNLLYIRKDLLKKYLKHTNQKLVQFVWGERDFKPDAIGVLREELQEVWSEHKHIHKKIIVIRL